MNKVFYSFLIVLLILTGCGKSEFDSPQPKKVDGFNLQEKKPYTVILIQLNEPSLTETENTELTRQNIEVEQSKLLADLDSKVGEYKVLFSYKRILNAVAVIVKSEEIEKLDSINAKSINVAAVFDAPSVQMQDATETNDRKDLSLKNSMTHIGVDQVNQLQVYDPETNELINVRGKGIKVGIIDSGVDYTQNVWWDRKPRRLQKH